MTNNTLAKCEQRDISGHGAEDGACIDGQNRAQAPAAPHDGQKKKLGEQNSLHLPHVQSSVAGAVRGGGGGRGGASLSRPSEYAACCLVPQSGQKANEAGESASQLAHVQSCGCSGPQSGQKRHDAGTTSLHSEQSHSSVRAGAGSGRAGGIFLSLCATVPQKGQNLHEPGTLSSNSSDCQSSPAAFAQLPHTQSAPPGLSTGTGSAAATAAVEKEEEEAAAPAPAPAPARERAAPQFATAF